MKLVAVRPKGGGCKLSEFFRLILLFRIGSQNPMGKYLDLAKTVETADICGKVATPCLEGECAGPVGLETDRECETREKSEERVGPVCPPGGRAVLLQVPDGVPEPWGKGVTDLLAMPPQAGWAEEQWKVLQEDALTFLKAWAAPATALGWGPDDLFNVHSEAPRARLDGMGLVPLLAGRPVTALTEDAAAITSEPGTTLTYRRRKVWPPGCRLVWELASSGSAKTSRRI